MHGFRNDYLEGAHPRVIEALLRTNEEQHAGYTEDGWCAKARDAVRRAVASDDAGDRLVEKGIDPSALQVEFVPGGTMANLLVIASALRPYECVVAAPDGHINVHETGAVEGCGHKVVVTDDADGLLSVEGTHAALRFHEYGRNFHMVSPRMLYLSLATETGLVHTARQLADLRAFADEHGLLLFVDGARLASGLAATDATLADVCAAADAFTVGGTKNGALFGEAVVIRNPAVGRGFRNLMKQKGAVMAKGRLLGVQFAALLDVAGTEADVAEAQGDEALYFSLGRHANAMADRLRAILGEHGYGEALNASTTNQLFLTLPAAAAERFMSAFDADLIARPDGEHAVVRMTCSWATTPEQVDAVGDELARW